MAGKADIVDAVADGAGLSKQQAADAVQSLIDSISSHLQNGDRVQLPGLGSFSVSHRAAPRRPQPEDGRAADNRGQQRRSVQGQPSAEGRPELGACVRPGGPVAARAKAQVRDPCGRGRTGRGVGSRSGCAAFILGELAASLARPAARPAPPGAASTVQTEPDAFPLGGRAGSWCCRGPRLTYGPEMRLAIVMPVLEEAARVQAAIAEARAHCDDLIVVDGGSRDCTVELASAAGARVETVPSTGRGRQLRAGADLAIEAGADVLLFLHADTRLPPAARRGIERAVNSGAAGGGFLIDFRAAPPLLRRGRVLVDLRTRWLRAPLGDQAQFATVAAYLACGGFSDLPILEDLDFIGRLRRQGRISIVEQRVATSSRRFAEQGVVRTVAMNWLIWSLLAAGVKPAWLAGLYPVVR